MPIYATAKELTSALGFDEVGHSSGNESFAGHNRDAITAGIRAASREIESYAAPYGLVPTDVGADADATAGTYPSWWKSACIEMAVYRMSLDGGTATKIKRQHYEDWIRRLEMSYPTQIGGNPVGGSITIVGGGREFSADKTSGL